MHVVLSMVVGTWERRGLKYDMFSPPCDVGFDFINKFQDKMKGLVDATTPITGSTVRGS